MNKMKEVAQLLGVELNEEFNISTLKNKYKFTSKGLETKNLITREWDISSNCFFRGLLVGELEIIKPILDNVEKEYLENVVRPFKDRVVQIIKRRNITETGMEYISIFVKDDANLCFPNFKSGSMYTGMEEGEEYTLKELGLFENE